jgi:hypothetical protein
LLLRGRYILVLGVLIASPIVYYLASPLFINVTVNERLTTNESTLILAKGNFTDADSFHKTSGTASILSLGNGTKILRFENFRTTNGPDLFVYLSTDNVANNFVNLGSLKGNIGDQNYVLPMDVDLTSYKHVLIWCRAFSILFGSAELSNL